MRIRRLTASLATALLFGLCGCATGGPHSAQTPAPTTSNLTTVPKTVPTTALSSPVSAVPAARSVYPVASMWITVSAGTRAGEVVDIPTKVWYPAGEGGTRVPLIVFSPGYQIDPSQYDVLTSDWAAAGYVVAEPQYPYTSLGSPPIEDDIVNHPAELSQVITTVLSDGRTAGLVASNEIAVAGQSDGGDVSLAAAYNSCCRDPRIRAAVIMSGAEWTIFGGAYYTAGGPPMLVVQGDQDSINLPACSRQLFNSAPGSRFYFDIPSGTHLSPYTAPVGPQVTAVRQVTTSFLDGYLKGMTTKVAELDDPEGASGVGHMIEGPATVPVGGACPGAPTVGGA